MTHHKHAVCKLPLFCCGHWWYIKQYINVKLMFSHSIPFFRFFYLNWIQQMSHQDKSKQKDDKGMRNSVNSWPARSVILWGISHSSHGAGLWAMVCWVPEMKALAPRHSRCLSTVLFCFPHVIAHPLVFLPHSWGSAWRHTKPSCSCIYRRVVLVEPDHLCTVSQLT